MPEPKKYKHTMKTLLAEWINREGGYLHQKFSILHNRDFDSASDAQELCAALKNPRADEFDDDDDSFYRHHLDPAWYTIAWQMTRANLPEVCDVIREKGLPEFYKRLDIALTNETHWTFRSDDYYPEWRCLSGRPRDFLFLINLLGKYRDPNALHYLKLAARHARFEKGGAELRVWSNWPAVFCRYSSPQDEALALLEALRDPIPTGKVAEGYLEFSNTLLQETNGEHSHPFDNSQGILLLHQIADDDDDAIEGTPGVWVAEALVFLNNEGRKMLLAKLLKHKNKHVRSAARKASK